MDEFHYYTNAEKTASAEGFQFYATLSNLPVKTGQDCYAVGNNLGVYNEDTTSFKNLYVQQTVMSGSITAAEADPSVISAAEFAGSQYPYLLTSASVSFEMLGGALYDVNGYLIGLLSYKLYDSTSQNIPTNAMTRIALATGVDLLKAYLDSVSQSKQIAIPYTTAGVAQEA